MKPLSIEKLTRALGNSTRWLILAELSQDQALMVTELSVAIRKSVSYTSKQLIILRETGAIEQVRGRMYAIPAQYHPAPGIVDYGYGPLRMKPPAPQPPIPPTPPTETETAQ